MKQESELKTATQLITEERERQISKEGWTIEHDDQHIYGELAKAADCYYEYAEDNDYTDKRVHQYWPWDKSWWKPKDQLRDYIRAGALYRAEKERLERTGGAVGPKLTNLRIGIRQCEIRIEEILSHESYYAKKDCPTPPVEMKTAEEIIKLLEEDARHYKRYGDHVEHRTVNECISKIKRFLPVTASAKSVEVEEAKCVMGCKHYDGGEIKHDKHCPYYSDSLSRTFDEQITTIGELREALEKFLLLEDLIGYCGEIKEEHIGEAQAINNAFRIAKEALKEKE